MKKLVLIILLLIFIVGCSKKEINIEEQTMSQNISQQIQEVEIMGNLKISSPAFENNQLMPAKYTCKGANVNPPLMIEGIPSEAKSLALIVDDPDAINGTFVHWVMWNIPVVSEIAENSVPSGAVQGKADFGDNRYQGPCPPSGTHRYFFKIYALDTILDLNKNSKKTDLESAMKGHILDKAELVGLFKKSLI